MTARTGGIKSFADTWIRGMLKYRDFIPEDQSRLLNPTRSYEHFDSLVDRANAWTRARGIEVINAETIVLPNIRPKKSSESPGSAVSCAGLTNWAQILRIWYQE